ncbi:hypothetical protein H6G80_07250 [Nostoc sp. FACHB-87]|uniref:hypothetical protein n=1 Tax=Nostocaceae TaxID=1162 RepID=UPI001687ED2B|nr:MULTISPECIES: hypothetical protein [Nostocaceae]MBD2297600.1 hypothetical protein [Nostoc sp. FACHB-190]MBD2453872.1 hypothetical protein [Nostoc sp. FACHB-87]MBD2475995.1 hypothetical protein [Anabaena sp. FACHB-83]
MNGIDWLRTLHTKELLGVRNNCYEVFRYPDDYVIYNNGDFPPGSGIKITYAELKQVLSERPHVPNKAETKRIRQKAAKQKVRSYQSSKF